MSQGKAKFFILETPGFDLNQTVLSNTQWQNRVKRHKPKYGKLHPNSRNPFFTMRASEPWKSLPKGAGDVTNLSPGWAALAHLLGDLQQPLPASISAVTQGCSYMRLFHNFPTFTSPTCPQPCSSIQAQCLLKAVFSRAGTTPNPQFLGLLLRQQQIFKGDERTWFKTAFGCYIFIT